MTNGRFPECTTTVMTETEGKGREKMIVTGATEKVTSVKE